MYNSTSFSKRYYEMSITTASPEHLVVMLYEGAIRFLRQAVEDINNRNIKGKCESVSRAIAIVNELQSTLDRVHGQDITVDLNRLYRYVREAIINGSMKLETRPIETAIKVLSTLLEAWEVVAARAQESRAAYSAPVSPDVLAGQRIQIHG